MSSDKQTAIQEAHSDASVAPDLNTITITSRLEGDEADKPTASETFANAVSNLVSQKNLDLSIQCQHEIYKRLNESQRALQTFNGYSAKELAKLGPEIEKKTKLIQAMKKDLYNIFDRISELRELLGDRYPEYAVLLSEEEEEENDDADNIPPVETKPYITEVDNSIDLNSLPQDESPAGELDQASDPSDDDNVDDDDSPAIESQIEPSSSTIDIDYSLDIPESIFDAPSADSEPQEESAAQEEEEEKEKDDEEEQIDDDEQKEDDNDVETEPILEPTITEAE